MKDAAYAFFAIALSSVASSACAMTVPAASNKFWQIVDGHKLPPASGGEEELCRAIDRAAASAGSNERFSVRIQVKPGSVLAADVTLADGRAFPSLHIAETDRPMSKDTFERFGRAIVDYAIGGAH